MRRHSYLGGVALAAVASIQACSSSSGSGNNVKCGPGTELDASVCYVGAGGSTLDGGGVDGVAPGDDSSMPVGPGITFGGAVAAAPSSATALLVTWAPASGPATMDGGGVFTYRVYLATAPGAENFAAPTVESAPGATSIVVDNGLTASTKYYVVVRAVDASGHEDSNTMEQSVTLQVDTMAPVFAGVTSVTSAAESALTISWAAATDDLTPPAAIVYDVYLATAAGQENLNLPNAVSLPGATSVTVSGLPQASTKYYVVVRAVDAAGNVDLSPESVVEMSGTSGSDDIPPVFAGCSSATQVDAQSIAVTWQGATDNSTPPLQIAYDVFASTTQGGQDFAHPTKTFTATGPDVLTGGLVDGLKSGTTYYLVCRAHDLSNNEDQNTFARVATTAVDSQPPVFAGATGTRNATPSTVDLYWNTPATDDQTPTAQIVYVAYQAKMVGGEMVDAGAAPVATSDPGATFMTIQGLDPDTKYYWIVRAEDRAGNIDGNSVEIAGTTQVSFSQNVVVVLGTHCAVTGCHIPGSPPNGLIMTPTQAYANLVGVSVVESPSYTRVDPGTASDSYIYLKITGTAPVGTKMPPPATNDTLSASEIAIITDWINQGAKNN
jgi:hypothetical protein